MYISPEGKAAAEVACALVGERRLCHDLSLQQVVDLTRETNMKAFLMDGIVQLNIDIQLNILHLGLGMVNG